MQLTSFSSFVKAVVQEGHRLQRYDINGIKIANSKFTQMQVISAVIAISFVFLVPRGFSNDFAGFLIGFLGIFIGLFTSIIISLFDKRETYFHNYQMADQHQKARLKKIKNYLVQFTGLTAYSILLALTLVILLTFQLVDNKETVNIYENHWISVEDIDLVSLATFLKATLVIIYRFLVIYLILNIFTITIYSVTSYFSFLSSEYKNIILSDD